MGLKSLLLNGGRPSSLIDVKIMELIKPTELTGHAVIGSWHSAGASREHGMEREGPKA